VKYSPSERVGELDPDDQQIDGDSDLLVDCVVMQRPAGVGRTEVEPRANRCEPDDEAGDIEAVLQGWRRRGEIADLEGGPHAADGDDGDQPVAGVVGRVDRSCSRDGGKTDDSGETECENVHPKCGSRETQTGQQACRRAE